MLRWNSATLLAVIIILIPALDQRVGSTSSAQSANGQNQPGSRHLNAPLPVSQSYLPPIVQAAELQPAQIPTVYSNSDGRVTYATIINLQPARDQTGQTAYHQEHPDHLIPQPGNPFADPPGSYASIQDQQNPFADPPQNTIPPDQQNPFADPPQDMDPRRFQDPFSPAQRPPDVDPFADSPQDIVPPDEFLMPADPATVHGMDAEANGVKPEPVTANRKNAGIAGPFKSRGFQPTPIQPAPPRQEYEFLNPHFLPGTPDNFYPNNHWAPAWDAPQDQPTLVDSADFGFQKSDLYHGMAQSTDVNNFATYECTRCFERTAGKCCEPMFYFAVFGGYVQLEDTRPFEAMNTIGSTSSDAALRFNDGFGIGVAIGQIQGENLRTEIEFAFRDNDLSELIAEQPNLSSNLPDLDGSIESFSGMMNFIWDFRDRPCFWGIRPYAGGGVGFAILESTLTDAGNSIVVDSYGSDSSFAYQLFAGLSRPVSTRLDGFVEYRYFKAESLRLNINVPATLTGDVEYETDNVFFGLRMFF